MLLLYRANKYEVDVNYVTIIHKIFSRIHICTSIIVTENKKDANLVIRAHLLC